MYKNTAGQKISVFAYNTADQTPKTGDSANITCYESIDGGTPEQIGTGPGYHPTELNGTNHKGWYVFTLTQAQTNGDELTFSPKSSTSGVALIPVRVLTYPGTKVSEVAAALAIDTTFLDALADRLTDHGLPIPQDPASGAPISQLQDDAVNSDSVDDALKITTDESGRIPATVDGVALEASVVTVDGKVVALGTPAQASVVSAMAGSVSAAALDAATILTRTPDHKPSVDSDGKVATGTGSLPSANILAGTTAGKIITDGTWPTTAWKPPACVKPKTGTYAGALRRIRSYHLTSAGGEFTVDPYPAALAAGVVLEIVNG